MPTLASELRNKLERVVIEARDVAEMGARAALEAVAVHCSEPYPHMKGRQRELRNKLRARARQLGDRQDKSGRITIGHLVGECAYEHWHRMLFARFLAENNLLIEPQENMAISLAEAEELAKEEGVDVWAFASRCAQGMLPQIFRPEDPLLQVSFATEHMLRLEGLLASLPAAVFTASDALGWVYQFWQSKKKDEVNRSEVKIGADELPAVTQLFTEPYMVSFLLHNTLGAWWAGKVAAASSRFSSYTSEADARRAVALPGVDWDYLRFVKADPDKVDAASSRTIEDKRQDAASTVGFYRKNEPVVNLSGNLPHWRQDAVTYFVTFRAADSLPQEKLQQWQVEREQWLAEHPEPRDAETMQEYYERFPERIERWLDQGYGACPLKEPVAKRIAEDALRHFDGERYYLDEFLVAANHVHALVTPKDGHELSAILHSWKSFTANKINRLLARSGALWQKEGFDHIVRNPAQLERLRQYIRNHIVAAASSRMIEHKRQDAASTWRPAAGTFDGWPKKAAELKVLDPCCGSGHFLVAALHHLVPIRMAEEDLSAREAVDAVLRDNLHGLEIDERCCQIAAFALAFEAWKLSGWKPLPPLHIACTGIGPQATEEQWVELAEQSGIPIPTLGREPIKDGLRNLHRLFSQAPILGSLIDPTELPADLITADYETIKPYLTAVLKVEQADDETRERAIAAAGMVKAADLLAGEYSLAITNVPYLKREKQTEVLASFNEQWCQDAKSDLATSFLQRCIEFLSRRCTCAAVTPHNWLYARSYTTFRKRMLREQSWRAVARLGPGAFETITGEVVKPALMVLTREADVGTSRFLGLDVESIQGVRSKSTALQERAVCLCSQSEQVGHPDAVVSMVTIAGGPQLQDLARSAEGLSTGDGDRYLHCWWELGEVSPQWEPLQTGPVDGQTWGGISHAVFWERGTGSLSQSSAARIQGQIGWGSRGVIVSEMSDLRRCLHAGCMHDKTTGVVIPKNESHLPAIWAYCQSESYCRAIRTLDKSLKIAPRSLVKVPFDLDHWQKVAAKKYPDGLPEPESDDPTQWLFHGHPAGKVEAASSRSNEDMRQDAASTLQVAVARLLGYRWPAELDEEMRLSKRARALVAKCGELVKFADDDGIVCIPSVRGEEPAAEQLLKLLAACGGSGILPLQSAAGSRSHLDLDDWLRNGFFEEHCKLFHHRPFIWHIWDGRKRDGFHALVNYHKLCGVEAASSRFDSEDNKRQDAASTAGRRLLESLTYSYLGEWITRQKDEVRRGEGGAEDRLAAALELQKRLEAILAGEPPFDIFVRWKPLHEQPIGWEPDVNDGVRLNIRPFLASDIPGGKKGAGILRCKPNIKWTKDRGKEPERPKDEYPWFWGWDEKTEDFTGTGKQPDGNRWNDCHYTTKAKQAARQAAKKDG